MKKKLLKRLTTVVVAVAMVATMVTGFSVDVKADDHPSIVCDNASHWHHYYVYHVDEDSNTVSVHFYTLESDSDPGPGTKYQASADMDIRGDGYTWYYIFNTDPVEGTCYFVNDSEETGICPNGGGDPDPDPTPTPTPEPKKAETVEKEKPAKEVDRDTFKSEVPYGTAGITNSNSKVGDLKVHKVNSITETNQKFLADAFAKQHGKRARILTTVSLHPRRELGVDNGKKESLIYSNLEKKPQTVYAVCYNQTDKAYYLTGTLDKDGVATFPDFILRDATNVTIFVLE